MNRAVLFLSGLVCVTGISWGANKNGSLVVRPNHDDSWSCSLKPLESATLTITVANPPSGYQLKSQTTDITSSLEEYFIWSGSYYVMNSAGTAAVTTVKVQCVWEPIPGEGGGGGTPPPLLYGSATGTAKAQPGIYWNEADTTVIAVGSNVTVNAWKDDTVPAPSSWSAIGPVSLDGTGASVTATGTAPSEEEYDAVVTSICDESGKSDTEVFTVVGVDRLEYWEPDNEEWAAMPDVLYVGLGQTKQFRAIRKPDAAPWPAGKPVWTGASGSGGTAMQTFDTGSTNAEDFKLVTAECGNTVTGRYTVLVLQFVSLTVEGLQSMLFVSATNSNGLISLAVLTGHGLYEGAYFDGISMLSPEGLTIQWELLFKQYFTRTITCTLTNGAKVIGEEAGWDRGDIYASTNMTISGTSNLQSTDSPSVSFLNIPQMYNDGVRTVTFTDVFNLYFFGRVYSPSLNQLLCQRNWGWSFGFTLSTNSAGEIAYAITDSVDIHVIP